MKQPTKDVPSSLRNAIGFTAAPLMPPVIVESTGRRFSASTAIPTLMLFKDGKVLGSIVAPASKAAIETFIRETLAQ